MNKIKKYIYLLLKDTFIVKLYKKIKYPKSINYVIMADGDGKRWQNYLGVPKHLISINNETLLNRTVRLLKENGIKNIIITSHDKRCDIEGSKRYEPKNNQIEVDRFTRELIKKNVCFMYGDVYYSEDAIKNIINNFGKEFIFFGNYDEIFAIKIRKTKKFIQNVDNVREKFLNNEIKRCIGWEVYRSIENIPFNKHRIKKHFFYINDETDDIDFPEDYEKFKEQRENNKKE